MSVVSVLTGLALHFGLWLITKRLKVSVKIKVNCH